MSKEELGRLVRVGLRDYWEREDTEFTPWLGRKENIALLGEALAMPIEVEATEQNVGPFRADILCRDQSTGTVVLIENQLERTDHTHLGQIITYASGLDAVRVVWIASSFTEEHRSALDWLNRMTAENLHFFGVEVELWRIGTSPPAPRFNVVAKPNSWAKTVSSARGATSGELAERASAYRRLWERLSDSLKAQGATFDVKVTGLQWVRANFGVNGFGPTISYSFPNEVLKVYLIFGPDRAAERYRAVSTERQAVESAVGEPLEWGDRADGGGWANLTHDLSGKEVEKDGFQWLHQRLSPLRDVIRDIYLRNGLAETVE